MSSAGDPDYESIPLNCGPSCLDCCDCRTGFNILMDGNLPTVGTYTLEDSSSFVIHSINWGWATTGPLFMGPRNEPTGHVGHLCCTRQIGCALATFADSGGGGAIKYYLGIYAELTATVFRVSFSYAGDTVIWFEWIRTATTGAEKPLCALPRGVASTLENAQLADYDPAYRYITEADSMTFLATPTYCNNDGGFTHGGGQVSANANDSAPCQCSKTTTQTAYTASVTGLDICYTPANMKPNASTWDFDLVLDSACLPAVDFTDGDGTGSQTGVKCDSGLSLCATPTWQASIAIAFDATPTTHPMDVSFQIDYYCNGSLAGSIFGQVEVPYDCENGLSTTPFTIALDEGGTNYGTVTVTLA